DYYEYGPRGLVSTGLIHPAHEGTIFESVDDIVDRFTCGDNTGIPPTKTHSTARQEFDYQRLGDRITPQFIEAHTEDDGTVLFDVLNVTCTDIAGNAVAGSWILAEDRPYHPAAGSGEAPQLAPVITINQFVSEVPAGTYEHPEGHVECADYLVHELATNNIRTPSTSSSQGAPVFTDSDGTEHTVNRLGLIRPGLHYVPHACSDKAGFITQTATFAFVRADGAPEITIRNEGASVAPGGRIPVSATCTDSDDNVLETTNSTYSEFYSILHSVNFGELHDVAVGRDYHVVFSCEDEQGREAWKSAKFTRTPAGPRLVLDDYEGDPRKESPESALRSIHVEGTPYSGPGATCTDVATGLDVPVTVEGAPDSSSPAGPWSKITYTCEAGGLTETVERRVRTLESNSIAFTPDTSPYTGGPDIPDEPTCLGTRENPIEPELLRVTAPDGTISDVIDFTISGTHTAHFECADPGVFKGKGGPNHLKGYVLRQEFTQQVVVPPQESTPFITLEGPLEKGVLPETLYVEDGFTCTDRPSYADITDRAQANFTAGTEMPNNPVTIEYTCTAADGDEAEPVYRYLSPEIGLHVRFDGPTIVRDTSGSGDLPGAQCWINDRKLNDITPPEVLDSGRTKGESPETYPADAPARIDPRYDNGHRFTIENWNRTHVMTFRCTDPDGNFDPVTQEFKIHHIPPRPFISGEGITLSATGVESDRSKADNLHVQGQVFDHKLQCGYYDGDEFNVYEVGDPQFVVSSGAITTATGVTKDRTVRYDCNVSGLSSAAIRHVAIVETVTPLLRNVADTPHTNDEVFTDTAACLGMFGGKVALSSGERPVLTRTFTPPGGTATVLSGTARATIAVGAATGAYTIGYECVQDVLGREFTSTATQTITVSAPITPGSGTNPALSNVPTEPILFKQGDAPPAHGVTCLDGTLDRTGDIVPSQVIDSATTNGTYAVTLTCDDGDGSPATAIVTYYVDGTVPVIDPPTGAGSDQE
ncbi:MAG: hypothetical protein MPJ07_08465, partial [Nitrosopumilus sp.]|nr:hypothetical protein [Nitrosopumilus sp.]